MIGKYKVAHLLGIAREHEPQFRHVEQELTKKGFICFAPAFYDLGIYEAHQALLDDMCYQKLRVSDLCVIVTPEHIGKSTTARVKQSWEMEVPVYTWDEKCPKLYECPVGPKPVDDLPRIVKKLHADSDEQLMAEIQERVDQYDDLLKKLKDAYDNKLFPQFRKLSSDTPYDMMLDSIQARMIKLRSLSKNYEPQLEGLDEFIAERRNVYHFERLYINVYRR